MRVRSIFAVIILVGVVAGLAALNFSRINVMDQLSLDQGPKQGVPATSACAITQPPENMIGINTHNHMFGTGADPDMITLGPKTGGCEGCPPYEDKNSMEFEIGHGVPVLAPIDMTLIGFSNRNAKQRTLDDGQVQAPFNDLELYFESASPDWPGMILCPYHLSGSPLLLNHNLTDECGDVEEWTNTNQAMGHLFFPNDDFVFDERGNAGACDALIGRTVKRGEVIGYAGSVGNHSMVSFRIKVPYTTKNPIVRFGSQYIHWVQPGSFFYWKCYTPEAEFPSGVLAYPFPCEDYQLPPEQYDINFKYTREP